MVSGRRRIETVESFAMLFVEEMPGERLFEEAVADAPVSSFSFLAIPNLILFCVFFLGTGDDGYDDDDEDPPPPPPHPHSFSFPISHTRQALYH
jgi:hypothetical protein